MKNSGFSYLYGSVSYLFGYENIGCFSLMKKLLGMKYDGAYDRQQCMSVMLSFNHDLWEDEEYHAAKRESNPHWRRKKEVYSAFQPGHVCFARIVLG